MDFDRLPNRLFLEILMQLPFNERVRLARVSKRFRQMSKLAITHTEEFDLDDHMFRTAKTRKLRKLIGACAGNLMRIAANTKHHRRIEMLSSFSCRRLTELQLSKAKIRAVTLRNLLDNNPNLRSLVWSFWVRPPTFPEVVCENVERINIGTLLPSFFESLVRACPNVKHIDLLFRSWESWPLVLSRVFASTPDLQTLSLISVEGNVSINQLEILWSLTSLRSLTLQFPLADDWLEKISKLRQLQCLELISIDGGQVTNRGIAALSRLQHLHQFNFSQYPIDEADIDSGILCLAECGRRLQVLAADQICMRQSTVSTLVQCCLGLRRMDLKNIDGIGSIRAAKRFVKSLDGFRQQRLHISVKEDSSIWSDDEVQLALRDVNSKAGTRSLIISFPPPYTELGLPWSPAQWGVPLPADGDNDNPVSVDWDQEENYGLMLLYKVDGFFERLFVLILQMISFIHAGVRNLVFK